MSQTPLPLPSCYPSKSMARKIQIVSANFDHAGPRGPKIDALTLKDSGEEIPLSDLVDDKYVSLFKLDVSTRRMVFVRTSEGVDLMRDFTFFDVGQIKNANELYIATFEDCFIAAQNLKKSIALGSNLSYIFNTGRCGSTLLHKLLLRDGVCSLSEPDWTVDITKVLDDESFGEAETLKLLECCNILGFFSVKLNNPDASFFSMNPKSQVTRYLQLLTKALPGVKIVFMSRDCAEVVESFSSMLSERTPLWKRNVYRTLFFMLYLFMYYLGLSSFVLRNTTGRMYENFVCCTSNLVNHKDLLPFFGKLLPVPYLRAVEWIANNAYAQKANSEGVKIHFLGFKEFLASKTQMVKETWNFLGMELNDRSLEVVLEGFNEHSQKDMKEMAKARAKYLIETDKKTILEMLKIPADKYV